MTLLSKLRGRSAAELRERAAQAASKRAERRGWRDAREPGDAALLQWAAVPSVEAWHTQFSARTAPRLFASFDDPAVTVRALRATDPDYAERVVQRADRAMRHTFDLLGYRDLDFGAPIDWHYDPVSRVRAPLRHWSAIDYLDARLAGDHKVIWELNRQQWLVDLGAAWWLTGDDRYAHFMVRVLNEWMDANPPKLGVNWASSLEVAFRTISWIWALEFLRRSAILDARTLARLTKHLVLHGRHVERYLSTYFSPNTHLTGEALSLFYLGTYLPELRQASGWRERGERVLLEQLPRHVRPDGVYFEQSVHYHRYTVDFYTHMWLLDAANGRSLFVEIAPQLAALLEHLLSLTRGDGSVPLFGDEDGGRLFFLDTNALHDLRGTLATGAVMLQRGDFAFAGKPAAEMIWLLGPTAPDRFAEIGAAPPAYASRAFEEGGVYVMRDGWGRSDNHMIVDCGPHGTMNCGHAHADALGFELALHGIPVLVDPGTYSYTSDPEARDAFRSSAAHNTAVVDGANSSEPAGPFHWRRIANARVAAWRTGADGRSAFFEGSHDGFEQLPHPVKYRRAVDFDPSGAQAIIVRDAFDCTSAHTAMLTFQCAPGIDVTPVSDNAVDLARDGTTVCRLEVAESGSMPRPRGRFTVEAAWVSRCYGARERAARCRYVTPLDAGRSELTTTVHVSPSGVRHPPAAAALTEVR
jgi:hypothetical protein